MAQAAGYIWRRLKKECRKKDISREIYSLNFRVIYKEENIKNKLI